MSNKRAGHRAIAIQDYLWVTGGLDDNNERVMKTEKIFIDGKIEEGPELPEFRWNHCLVKYNDTVILLGGDGDGNKKQVWLLDTKNNFEKTNGPELNTGWIFL